MPLTNQVVLITGCSSGIGRALALELDRRGHRVFASARNPESLDDLPASIGRVALDVTDAESTQDAVQHVLQTAGPIQMLVNNAGINVTGPLVEIPLSRLRQLFDTNVTGLIAVTQAVFPSMAEQRRGRIVNIGSIVHLLATPFGGAYAGSKAAVHVISEALRMEVEPFGIDVIEVQPGGVRSSLSSHASVGLERYREASSRYHAAYPGIVKRANASQNRPMPADAFARRLADAILAQRAPRQVRLGTGAESLPWLKRLPPKTLDRLLTRRFGLDSLRT